MNNLIYKCLFKLIPYEYIKKLYSHHEDLLRIKREKDDRILKAKAEAEINEFLAKKPSNYLDTLVDKTQPDLVPLGTNLTGDRYPMNYYYDLNTIKKFKEDNGRQN